MSLLKSIIMVLVDMLFLFTYFVNRFLLMWRISYLALNLPLILPF